jgi:tetratricopeptide (TPR) repeat protein
LAGRTNAEYDKKALIVAVSNYDDTSKLRALEFCKNDGQEMYSILKRLGYDIPDNRKLIGFVDSRSLTDAIYDFFYDGKPNDILVFYYSGHGVPDNYSMIHLAPSDIDSERPRKNGFSFDALTKAMLDSSSLRVVTILDSCYSGSLKMGLDTMGLDTKGGEYQAKVAKETVSDQTEILEREGQGRCLLAACQGYQEAYNRQEKDHSIFTYYLLEGLKGQAVDDDGNVTYESLGKFINYQINNLPFDKRPQLPVRKGELSGDVILAMYPQLKKNIKYTNAISIFNVDQQVRQSLSPTKLEEFNSLMSQGSILAYKDRFKEALQKFENAILIDPNSSMALSHKSSVLIQMGDYNSALTVAQAALKIDDKNVDALFNKGYILAASGDYERAIEYYNKVTDLDFKNANAWRQKSYCYRRIGRKGEAKECLKIANNLI